MDKIKFYSENKRKGIVEQVKVQVGQPVKADTPLVKVQTSDGQMVTILADTDGIVGEIKIVESIIVKPGETMFEILKDYEVDKLLKKPRKIGDTLREGLELFGFFNKTTDDIASEYDELIDDEFIGESEDDAEVEEIISEPVHQADEQVLESLNVMDEDYITNNLESINEANEVEAEGKSSMTLFKEEILQQYFGDENEQEVTPTSAEDDMMIVGETVEEQQPETEQLSDSFDPDFGRINQFAPETDYNLNTEIDMTWSNLDINLETLDNDSELEELNDVSLPTEAAQDNLESVENLEFEHVAVNDSITEELSNLGALNELEEAKLERDITNLIEEEIIEQKLEEFNDNLVVEEAPTNQSEFLSRFEQNNQEINLNNQSLSSETATLLDGDSIKADKIDADREKNIFLKNFARDEQGNKPEIEIIESEVVKIKNHVNNDLVMVEDLSTNPPVDDIIKINQDNLVSASEAEALKKVVGELSVEHERKFEANSEKFNDVRGKIDRIFKEQNLLKQKVNGYSRYDDSKIKSRLNKITEKQNAFDQKLGSLTSQKNHGLDEKIKQLIDKQEQLVKKIEVLERDNAKLSASRVEVATNGKAISSIDFEVEVTGLLNLHTLMFDPYSDKNINLGLNSFYLKALRMVLNKFREYDFNDNQTISLALISKNRFVFRDIKIFEKTSIGEIAQQVQSARNIDKPKNILLYDLGRHKVVSSKLSLPNNAIFSLAVGDVQQKVKSDNVLSDYVNVSVSFDQNFISVFEAMAFTKAFNEIINNPGLLI